MKKHISRLKADHFHRGKLTISNSYEYWRFLLLFFVFEDFFFTHHYNEEIEPAPGVGEVLGKSQGHELNQHLNEEDDGEYSVHVEKDVDEHGFVAEVDVLQGKGHGGHQNHGNDGRFEVFVLNELVSLQTKMGPTLPEGGIWVSLK